MPRRQIADPAGSRSFPHAACSNARSFAAQDVLVPWHLADHHNKRKPDRPTDDVTTNTDTTNAAAEDGRGGKPVTNSFEPDGTTAPDFESSSGGGLSAPGEVSIEAAGASGGDGGAGSASCAPTPTAPRHGIRVDAADGSGGSSVVYQRYCHVYAEGELEGLVGRVDGMRLVDSYYDRSNWCVVAEREG